MSRVAFTRFCRQIHQSARNGVRGGGSSQSWQCQDFESLWHGNSSLTHIPPIVGNISFLTSLYQVLFKNYSICMVYYTVESFCICVYTVFVYLYFLFPCLTTQNIIYDILVSRAFQKYSTWLVLLSFYHSLYLRIHCICVFLILYFHVWHLKTSFLTSLFPVLSKNIAHYYIALALTIIP